jgi:hypothetical protein
VNSVFTHFFILRFINRKRLISVNSLTGQEKIGWGTIVMEFPTNKISFFR